MGVKVVARNRKAKFNYFITESLEAGISLVGSEIKSIRNGAVSLEEAYIKTDGRQAFLVNAHIAPYEEANRNNHVPVRDRRLLLHKREIRMLFDEIKQKGMTIVPTQMYLKDGRAKVEIGIARGKKLYDKRDEIAKRDQEREALRDRRSAERR